MLKRLISSIRRQPKQTRDKFAFSAAVAVTAVVFSVWLYNMPARMSEFAAKKEQVEEPGPFSQVFDKLSEQTAAVKEAIPELTKELSPQVDVNADSTTTAKPSDSNYGFPQEFGSVPSSAATTTIPSENSSATTASASPVTEPAQREVRIMSVPASTSTTEVQ